MKCIAPTVLLLFSLNSFAACNIVSGEAYGDCGGVTINKGTNGFLKVASYKSISEIIDGAQILPGGTLFLSGMNNGNISVAKNGKLVVTGTSDGTITNNGGTVEIEGTASSVVANSGSTIISGIASHVSGNGKITYIKGAVVNGMPIK